jgi:hypothetical protein
VSFCIPRYDSLQLSVAAAVDDAAHKYDIGQQAVIPQDRIVVGFAECKFFSIRFEVQQFSLQIRSFAAIETA